MSLKNVLQNRAKALFFMLDSALLPRVIKCNVRGHKVFLDVENFRELKRAKSYESKEPDTLNWLIDSVRGGDVLYDIGANIGLYSLFPAIREPGCKVLAFEPEALNFAKLNKNIHLNNLSGRIFPYPVAFSDSVKLDKFFVNKFRAGNALHSFGINRDNKGKEFVPAHVQGSMSITLDQAVYEFGLEFPNYIKIDVDGLEKDIVKGGSKMLKDERVRSVLVELGNADDKKWFADFFAKWGFHTVSSADLRGDTQNLIFKRT